MRSSLTRCGMAGRAVVVLLLILPSACVDQGTVQGDRSSGVIPEVVSSLDDGWSAERAWRLEEAFVTTGAPGSPFGEIADIAVDDGGRLYVIDFGSQEILVFDRAGAFVRSIGGHGEGPGEFTGAAGLNWDSEGHLWVWDYRSGRFSEFSMGGDFIRVMPRELVGPVLPWPGKFVDGKMIDRGFERVRLTGDGPVVESIVYAVQLDTTFAIEDTIETIRREHDVSRDGSVNVVFGGRSLVFMDYTGTFWVSDRRNYEIAKRQRGEVVLRFGLDARAAPVTQVDRDTLAALIRARMPPPLVPSRLRALDDLPETKRVVHRIFDDGGQYIFVLPHLEGIPPGTVLDVFGRDGSFVGRLDLPKRITTSPPPVVTGDALYALALDELGASTVIRWNLIRP